MNEINTLMYVYSFSKTELYTICYFLNPYSTQQYVHTSLTRNTFLHHLSSIFQNGKTEIQRNKITSQSFKGNGLEKAFIKHQFLCNTTQKKLNQRGP